MKFLDFQDPTSILNVAPFCVEYDVLVKTIGIVFLSRFNPSRSVFAWTFLFTTKVVSAMVDSLKSSAVGDRLVM